MSVIHAGTVNSEGTKADIIKDLIQHAKRHYEACDETKLMTRLDKMGKLEIKDLANNQGAFHHFFITTNSQSKRNLYGLGEHGSNMKRDCKITIEMNTTFDLNTMCQILSRLINESVGQNYLFDLMPTEDHLPTIHATIQSPPIARQAREYYQKDEQTIKIRVGSTQDFQRLLNPKDSCCKTGAINLNNGANGQYTLKREKLTKEAKECQFVIFGSHPKECTNIAATES